MNIERPELGHGHVNLRNDGHTIRCGGPRFCRTCADEKQIYFLPRPLRDIYTIPTLVNYAMSNNTDYSVPKFLVNKLVMDRRIPDKFKSLVASEENLSRVMFAIDHLIHGHKFWHLPKTNALSLSGPVRGVSILHRFHVDRHDEYYYLFHWTIAISRTKVEL